MAIAEVPVVLPDIPDYVVDIGEFGAVANDYRTDQAPAFDQAMAWLSDRGGGRLRVGPGLWHLGPIHLKSHVELNLARGAVLVFSRRWEDYALQETMFEGTPTVRAESPISGRGVHDVAITGQGLVDGGGQAWRPVKRSKMTDGQWKRLVEIEGGVVDDEAGIWWPDAHARDAAERLPTLAASRPFKLEDWLPWRSYLRPALLSIIQGQRILLDSATFQNSPAWCLHLFNTEDITIQNITVRNPWYAQNGDGLDLDSCRRALVERCTFDVGDDAICLKSGRDQAGRELGLPTCDVMVRDCTVFHGHGGLTIGSEMSGGVRRVRAEHLTLIGTDIGLRFKSARGRGGIVEDIVVRAVHMLDISDVGIAFDLFYEGHGSSEEEPAVPVTEETPIFRQITLQDVVMSEAKQAIRIRGLPEAPIEALTIERVTAISQTGSEVADVQHLSLREARLMSRHAPVLRITNTRQSVVQGYFEATKKTGAEALLVICGEHTEAVTVQTSQSVEIAEEVRGEVQLADRSRIGGLDVE